MPKKNGNTTVDDGNDNVLLDPLGYVVSLFEFASGYEGVRSDSHGSRRVRCQVPSHQDDTPSLNISQKDGRVVLFCFSGTCTQSEVYQSARDLGATDEELSGGGPKRKSPGNRAALKKEPVQSLIENWVDADRYEYRDARGDLLYTKIRLQPPADEPQRDAKGKQRKTFKIVWADSKLGREGTRRVLFGLPELKAGLRRSTDKTVWFVEGEKDVRTLREHGQLATCAYTTRGDLEASWFEFLRHLGMQRLVVVRDKDEAGRDLANRVVELAESITRRDDEGAFVPAFEVALKEAWAESKPGADITDHLEAGWSLDQLVDVGTSEAAADADARALAAEEKRLELQATAQANVRVRQAAASIPASAVPKRRTELVRRSHEYLIKKCIPKRGTGELYGASGSYKTFVLIDAMMHIAGGAQEWHGFRVRQGNVLYVAAEGGAGFRTRMDAWLYEHGWFDPKRSAALAELDEHIRVIDEPFPLLAAHELIRRLPADWTPDLIVYDTRSNVTEGLEENSSTDMKQVSEVMRSLAARLDAAVMTVHHTGNSEEAADRGRGSQAIRDLGDFALQAEGDQDEGLRATVFVRKFKEGERHEFGLRLTSVHLQDENGPLKDDDGDPITSLTVTDERVDAGIEPKVRLRRERQQGTQRSAEEMKEQREATNTELAYRLQKFVEENPGVGSNASAEHLGLSARRVQAVRDLAVEEGLVKVEPGPNNTKKMYAL